MTAELPACPKCAENFTYEQDPFLVCPMCAHEWVPGSDEEQHVVGRDAVGNELVEGDTVTVVKDLKVKGGSGKVKIGTKVKGIRILSQPVADHDIEATVPGAGKMYLKSSVVKKQA